MVPPKRNEAGRAYQQSRNILIRRLREGQELSEIEESYLKKTGGTIRVRRPEYYQKMRWNYVSGLMRGPREQRWNEIYEIRNF